MIISRSVQFDKTGDQSVHPHITKMISCTRFVLTGFKEHLKYFFRKCLFFLTTQRHDINGISLKNEVQRLILIL